MGSWLDLVLWATGWTLGWLLLVRERPLPPLDTGAARPAVAVVIPARNEAHALPHLLPPLLSQRRPGDEILVVDDHSDDDTGAVARALGASVSTPPALPDGWLGKPHACWHGTMTTDAPILVFLDADVRPGPDLLDRLSAEVHRHEDTVVSVQPWHETGSFGEQISVLCNVTALMGSGAFTVAPGRTSATVAFGPVLALARVTYDAVGGHSAPGVRSMHTEDIALARAVGNSRLFTGRPDTRFRMYPGGWREAIQGWTRSLATGAAATRWWVALCTLAWVWSLAGGWLASPWVAPLSAIQFWVLGRRAASIHPITALLYPVAVAGFLVIIVRSVFALLFGRSVPWKGRAIATR